MAPLLYNNNPLTVELKSVKQFISLPAFSNDATNTHTPALIADLDSINYLQLVVLGQPPSFAGDFSKVKAFSINVGAVVYSYALPVDGDQYFDISGLVGQLFGAGFVHSDNTLINVNNIALIKPVDHAVSDWPNFIHSADPYVLGFEVKFKDGYSSGFYFNSTNILPMVYYSTTQIEL